MPHSEMRPSVAGDNEPQMHYDLELAKGPIKVKRGKLVFEPMPVADNPCPYPAVYDMGQCCGKCPEMVAVIEKDKE